MERGAWRERAGKGFEAVWLWVVLLGGGWDTIVILRLIRPVAAFYEAAIRALALVSALPGIIDYPLLVIRKPNAAEALNYRMTCAVKIKYFL